MIRFGALVVIASGALAAPAGAQTFNSGSTGALGALNVTSGTVTLTTPPDGAFHYTTIDVSNATLKFTRNVANTPITVLASGNVTINNGTIDVSGATGGGAGFGQTFVAPNGGAGGPGGFDAGSGANGTVSTTGGNGLGPGGGGGSTVTNGAGSQSGAGGGGFGSAGTAGGVGSAGTAGAAGTTYGAPTLLPLIGGSGGGGGGAIFGNTGGGGGGGAGAIIIASSGTITLTGGGARILAQGGVAGSSFGNGGVASGGGGSGGSVRLIATSITGSNGQILVNGGGAGGVDFGGAGGAGRVRIEAFTNTLGASFGGVPPSAVTSAQPTTVVLANTPTLRIMSIAGVATPASPTGSFATPDVTLAAGTTNPVTVVIAGFNIPVGTVVTVAVSGVNDGASTGSGTLSGTVASSTASATVTIPTAQPSVISATATFVLADLAGGPVYADGELIERVRVSATAAGLSRVSYITRSGREVFVRGQ
jgi:hypothetical protein